MLSFSRSVVFLFRENFQVQHQCTWSVKMMIILYNYIILTRTIKNASLSVDFMQECIKLKGRINWTKFLQTWLERAFGHENTGAPNCFLTNANSLLLPSFFFIFSSYNRRFLLEYH